MGDRKDCSRCGESKDRAEFWRSKRSKDGLQSYCRECSMAYEREKYTAGNRKPGARARHLRQKYDLTEGEFEAMLVGQGCRCAICGEHAAASNPQGRPTDQAFRVDHNHRDGEVRGLLCNTCNRVLGLFNDDVDRFMAAAAYLLTSADVLTVSGE